MSYPVWFHDEATTKAIAKLGLGAARYGNTPWGCVPILNVRRKDVSIFLEALLDATSDELFVIAAVRAWVRAERAGPSVHLVHQRTKRRAARRRNG